jgi:hypothetical protein
MIITPIGEYSEQELATRPAKDSAGNDRFKPLQLTATLKRRALKRIQKNKKPRARNNARQG